MKKLLLIGPFNKELRSGQFSAPPLGIHRLASYIENKKLADVDVIDPNIDIELLYSKLDSIKYDFIGSSLLHNTIENDLRILFDVNDKQPDALKIVGGQGAVFNYENIFGKTPVDIIVRGFGEKQLEKIITNGSDLLRVDGLHIKKEDNFISTALLETITCEEFRNISLNLDFNKIPYERYWDNMGKYYGDNHLRAMKNEGMLKTIRLMTSNYCPMGCTSCSSTNFVNESSKEKQTFLQLSPEEIVFLITRAADAHPTTDAFYFNDDNFMFNKTRVDKFCELMAQNNKEYNFMCMSRVDNVDNDILNKMSDANFKIIFYGVETFSNRLAKIIKKTKHDNYSEMAYNAVSETLSAGIVPQISLMFFLPDSKEKDIEITIDNAVDLMKNGARITVFPYVEAYFGAEIIKNHELNYVDFEIRENKFRFPKYVLPDDSNIRTLAYESIKLKESINEKFKQTFNGLIPQPIDSLNLFTAVYRLLGKQTNKIESVVKDMLV